jgi:hypothetical protein
MDLGRKLGVSERQLLGKSEVYTALKSLTQNETAQFAGDRQPHRWYIETGHRGTRGLFPYPDQKRWQIIVKTAVEVVIGKSYQHFRPRLLKDLTRSIETSSQVFSLRFLQTLPIFL